MKFGKGKAYKKLVYGLVGVIVCSSFAGIFFVNKSLGASKVVQASYQTSINKAEDRKEELEKKKKETEAKIARLEEEKEDVLAYIEKLDRELAAIQQDMKELNAEIAKVDAELLQAEKDLEEAIAQEEKQYNSMKLRIKYMYENGDSDYISLLLEADSFGDFLNRTEYIAKISEYDQKSYENYKLLKQKVVDTQAKLEEQRAELGALKEELAYEENAINTLHANKAAELARYKEKINLADSEVDAFQKKIDEEEARIEDLLEAERKRIEEEKRKEEERKKQEAAQNGGGSNTSSSGQVSASGFRWPLSVSGRITSYFGNREQPTPGASTYHKGIDIGAPTGTPILAAAAGEVVTAKYSSSAGNYVMLYHGNSTYTVYMHCSSLNVSVGQQVSQGQNIAAVGSTGYSTGPHLHFGISVNGSYVNPLNYVKQ